MATRILPSTPGLTRLHRLTDAEIDLICNYRLLEWSGRRLIADTISRVIAGSVSQCETQDGKITALRDAFTPTENDCEDDGEPTSLHRMTHKESGLMCAYRVMDEETKSATDYMFSQYLMDEEPHGGNVVSIHRYP